MILKIKHILNRNKISLAIIFLTIMAVIPASAQMVENFDSAVVTTLPAGWTATNASGPAPLWVTSNSGTPTPVADSAPNAAFINDPNVVSDKILTTPAFSPLSGAQVTFRNNYVLESGFDGGVLEISINGSRFIDIVTAGGSFVTGGYNGTITTTNFGSPIQGRAAWTGTSSGFITTTANLPASAVNQLVRLRFRLGTDNSTAGTGWRIDSFRIADVATSQNFDEVTAPSLPAGWTATNASGPAPLWVTSNSGTPTPVADSAPNAAFIDDPSAVSDKILTTPSFRIGANAQVTFRNNYVLQSGFDGGVLEISINGGVFTDIVTAGGSIVTGGYNGNIYDYEFRKSDSGTCGVDWH